VDKSCSQRQPRSLQRQQLHQRRGIDLVADRRIAGDNRPFRHRDRQPPRGDGLRCGGPLLAAQPVPRCKRSGAEFAFGWGRGGIRHAIRPETSAAYLNFL